MNVEHAPQPGLHLHPAKRVNPRSGWIKHIRKNIYLYGMLVPPTLFFLLFKYLPIAGTLLSVRKFKAGGGLGTIIGTEWIGFKYFRMFLEDPSFWIAFKNTIVIGAYGLLFGFPIPILFALLLNEVRTKWFKRFVQTTSYLPHFISSVIIYGLLNELLSPSTGIINSWIRSFGGEPIIFLLDPAWYRTIYTGSGIWQSMGFNAILYLAALSNVDPQLYEAAEMDGASRFRKIYHVTLPGIMPTIVITLILAIGNLLGSNFDKALLLFNGANQETSDILSTYLYRIGIVQANYNYGTAAGLFNSLISLMFLWSANRFSRRFSETSLW